ncbi:MAG TPA: preprotein translocase subunit TatC [Thermodesulfatator atlanticus]|uniref:Sec-independent protein translocase protein TatC n=1 Tax=Thermodesulfatator atlanticus TaxID=501497 RepID=A0A7V5P1N9_9BACT|nr:preprotein translocase subunit TatC [Thermodesulfatator atlanticus]
MAEKSAPASLELLGEALLSIRKRLILAGALFLILTVSFYFFSPRILATVQRHLGQELAFFGVMEPFLALLKIALACAALIMVPYFLWLCWLIISSLFGFRKSTGLLFIFSGMFLFYGGVAFCYLVTLPYGVKFLLSFQKEDIVPTISVGHFVNFVGLFLLAFGIIFELPLIMVTLARAGVLDPRKVSRFRRHAILVITILAAILTPTPDVFNLALMAVPLYLLFEVGLLVSKLATR